MKSLFKLAILLLLANGLFRFSVPYWHHHQFESALKGRILFWRDSSDETILTEVLDFAAENSVPVGREQIDLRRENEHLFLNVGYTLPIEFVPTVIRPWRFDIKLTGRVVRPRGS